MVEKKHSIDLNRTPSSSEEDQSGSEASSVSEKEKVPGINISHQRQLLK
jgi:hypothetical protein